ncbi:MAG: type II toxin-antitoxin system VapC family toxin [Rectinemataceae bacterium]
MKIVLDTNAYSGFMAGDKSIFDYVVASETVYLSTVMLGELYAGFQGGTKYAENVGELLIFIRKEGVRVVDVSIDTAEIFGEIKSVLAKKGKMIPLNDVWIAAHAIETGAKLVTYDNHFTHIAGLRLWNS